MDALLCCINLYPAPAVLSCWIVWFWSFRFIGRFKDTIGEPGGSTVLVSAAAEIESK